MPSAVSPEIGDFEGLTIAPMQDPKTLPESARQRPASGGGRASFGQSKSPGHNRVRGSFLLVAKPQGQHVPHLIITSLGTKFTDAAPGREESFDIPRLPRMWVAKELLIRVVKRGHTVRPASIVASTGRKRGCPTLGERGKRATPVE